MAQIRYECPYPHCTFTHEVDDTTLLEDVPTHENILDAHLRKSAEIDAVLEGHLNTTHPGWDEIEIARLVEERNTRQQAGPA